MALVPVNIQIDFTANYAGQHRVAYRIVGAPAYSFVTTTCVVGACQVLISVMVDNETCTTVQYEGYVQPVCQDIASTDGRTPWSIVFTPTPACARYIVTCESEGVASVTITDPHTGYDVGNPPSVLFTGGGGTGAAGTAVVGPGNILTVGISDAGTGYANNTYTAVTLTGGSGTGAEATVVIAGGIVTSVTITNNGTGYVNSDVLGIDPADVGGAPATPAQLSITSDYSTIIQITMTNNGSGYTTPPTVTIAGVGLGQATGTAVLSACEEFSNYGCNGVEVVYPVGTLPVGSQVALCSTTGAPVLPANFDVLAQGSCLCSCTTATIGVSGPIGTSVRYFYNDCGGAVVTGILTVGGSPSSIVDCIVTGSLVFQTLVDGTTGTVSYGGSCS